MTVRLVFDNSPLSHFARAGRLDTLHRLTIAFSCATTIEVRVELVSGIRDYPDIADALSLPWLDVVALATMAEITAFAGYKTELGGGPDRNVGEATVLAWARTHEAIAIIDDRAATRIAQRDGITARGSLGLIVGGLRSGVLERAEAEHLIDELRATGMYLPVDGPGLIAWAYTEGLLP